jgi:hypothetical protein
MTVMMSNQTMNRWMSCVCAAAIAALTSACEPAFEAELGVLGACEDAGDTAAECGDASEGETAASEDLDPPELIALVPSDASEGVLPEAEITFVFSEPMDEAATEAAYRSDRLPADAVEMRWSADGKTLTVTPISPLAVAEGDDLEQLEAERYGITLTTSARDLAGNQLAAPVELEFTTARRITAALAPIPELSGSLAQGGTTTLTGCLVGDNKDDEAIRLGLSFSLAQVPERVLRFERVVLGAEQVTASGAGETSVFASHDTIAVAQAWFEAIVDLHAAAWVPIGLFSDDAVDGWRELDVTDALVQSRALDEERIQFRLGFTVASDHDGAWDTSSFECASMVLDLSYLLP